MQGFVGWDMKVASTNLWSDYRVDAEGNTPSFFKVLQKNLLLQLLHLPILLLILLLPLLPLLSCSPVYAGVLSVLPCSNGHCRRGKPVRVASYRPPLPLTLLLLLIKHNSCLLSFTCSPRDLKDPSYSIPKGTFAAIGSTFVTYFVYFIMVGCVAVK